jgi:RNA polymerase sigma factor (sigma-70 family)
VVALPLRHGLVAFAAVIAGPAAASAHRASTPSDAPRPDTALSAREAGGSERLPRGDTLHVESGVFRSARPGGQTPGSRAPMSLDEKTEEQALIARAAAGDTESFRVLYTRHRSDVARLVYRMIGAPADLDDVVQEVFFQVFKSLKDFRGQAKFSTWLHRVTVNVVLMHRRAARSRPTYAEEQTQDTTADDERVAPDEDVDRRERVRAFARLLDRLAEKKRIVFVLHELEGMAPAEIAKAVGAPVLTIRTRLFYARREIEAMLCDEPALAGLRAELTEAASQAAQAAQAGVPGREMGGAEAGHGETETAGLDASAAGDEEGST